MRAVIVGLGSNGRSRVVKEWEFSLNLKTPRDKATVSETADSPPRLTPAPGFKVGKPGGRAIPAGGTRWQMVYAPANMEEELQATNTLDYIQVVEGETTLILQEGEVRLSVGDAVVLPGVPHGWQVGPSGMILNSIQVGGTPELR